MKKVTSTLFMLLLCFVAYGQQGDEIEQKLEKVEIYFDLDSYVVDTEFQENRVNLDHLVTLINQLHNDSLTTINEINVSSFASPEGGKDYNTKLSAKRASSLYDYIVSATSVPEVLIKTKSSGIDWDGLTELVMQSDMEYKEEVLDILENTPEETWKRVNPGDRWLTLVDSRVKQLMDLKYGIPYRYMALHFYPQLRRASVVKVYFQTKPAPAPKPEPIPEPEPAPAPEPEPVVESAPAVEFKPLFALKTNLLYDAVTALNVELEIPIGDRWSVAGEWIFPWWTSCGNPSNAWQNNSKRNTFELLQGNLEAKYWFGDRSNRPQLTGWYAGLYGGAGKYDLEYNAEGYQGEFYVVGVSGGYAHTINKSGSLRLEYSLGLGYMESDYHHYNEHIGIDDKWHTVRQAAGTRTWLGPTKAKVSLVWMLNRKVNKEK